MRPALSIVIPACNEEARISATLRATRAFLDQRAAAAPASAPTQAFEILVVDDGSRDGTAALVEAQRAEDPRVTLLRLPHNQGKGAAVRTGVLRSRGERVLFMDADLATPLSELAKLEAALAQGAAVAIASRALPDSQILQRQHPLRQTLGKTFNVLVRALSMTGFRDTQCGFKLFTRAAADALFRESTVDRFAFDVELLLLARGRFRVAEVPVRWRHVEESKVSVLRDATRMAYDVVRMRVRLARRRW